MPLNASSLKLTFRMNQRKTPNTPNSSCRKHSPNLVDDLQPRLSLTVIFSWASSPRIALSKRSDLPRCPTRYTSSKALAGHQSLGEGTEPNEDQTWATLAIPYHLPSCQLRSLNRREVGETMPCRFISVVSSDNSQQNRPGRIKFICATTLVACCSRDLFLGLPQMLQIVFGFFWAKQEGRWVNAFPPPFIEREKPLLELVTGCLLSFQSFLLRAAIKDRPCRSNWNQPTVSP